MKSLAAALILEKNKLSSTSPWLIFLDLDIGGTSLYLVQNIENISFGGHDYTAFPFTLDTWTETTQGDVPQLKIQVSNVSRIIQVYAEAVVGAVDSTVTLYLVNSDNLGEDYADLTLNFRIVKTECDAMWVTFYLGLPSPMHMRFPRYRYFGEHCNWIFKGAECGYTGATTTCDRTFSTCGTLQNTERFGGFIGLSRSGIRFVG